MRKGPLAMAVFEIALCAGFVAMACGGPSDNPAQRDPSAVTWELGDGELSRVCFEVTKFGYLSLWILSLDAAGNKSFVTNIGVGDKRRFGACRSEGVIS